jgi:hypothetical protein
MSGTNKLLLDVHGTLIPYERNAYDPSNQPYLNRLLPQAKIAPVGDYYHCLRQRPEKKGNAFEYVPNLTHRYKDVKRTLAQINIQVLPSRMWDELPLSTTTDQQLHHISSGVLVTRLTSQRWRTHWRSHSIWLGNRIPSTQGRPGVLYQGTKETTGSQSHR